MNRLRGLAALAALATVVIGVPWALWQHGHWPITGVPTADQVRDLGDHIVSDTAVFGVLTVAAWAVWALFLRTLLVEIVAAARGMQAPRVALGGPLQGASRYLVAAVLVALTVNQPARPAAAHTDDTPPSNRPATTQLVTDRPVTPPAAPPPRADAVVADQERTVTVGRATAPGRSPKRTSGTGCAGETSGR